LNNVGVLIDHSPSTENCNTINQVKFSPKSAFNIMSATRWSEDQITENQFRFYDF